MNTNARRMMMVAVVVVAILMAWVVEPVRAALLISYNMESFVGPVTSSNTASLINGGTYAGHAGTVLAFGAGSVTATAGAAIYTPGDTALEFNGTTGNSPDGGLVRFEAPAITANYSFGYSIRRDGDSYTGAKIFDPAEAPSMEGGAIVGTDVLRITIAHKSHSIYLPDGEWVHIVLTYQESSAPSDPTVQDGVATWYVNGEQVWQNTTVYSDPGGTVGSPRTDDLYSGSHGPTGQRLGLGATGRHGWWDFNGALDNFFIYDETLSGDAVAAIYMSTIPEPGSLTLLVLIGTRLLHRRPRRRG